ncbi:selenoprotein K [Parasteatoda tepidariorum]|uniref:selenoprotein K n=1 Tax=Parasteatoda tepidariorum TaxID=114398 RepID=UPI00077FE3BE|nr:selenoprotein K [Parasteatoda tepidariorum]
MPRVSDSGSSLNNSLERVSNLIWGFFNLVYFYFSSLLDPFVSVGRNSNLNSRSRNDRGPPRPPGRGNFRSFSDISGSSNYVPPPPPGG